MEINKKIINSQNLISNLNYFKKRSKVCAVIKANAYGLGLEYVAKLLSGRVDYFGVANTDEALVVRNIDEKTPIIILGKTFDLELCKQQNFEFFVESVQDIIYAKKFDAQNLMHLKIDCGMNRFGAKDTKQITDIANLLRQENIVLKGVYTHFPNLKNSKKTAKNCEIFEKKLHFLQKNQKKLIHVGGTGAIDLNIHFDMCRAGLGLFGYFKNCKNVLSLQSKIVDIKQLKKGERLGYDGTYIANKNEQIGIVPLGYADGIKSNFAGFKVLVCGKACKIVGRVCMDCFFVKVPASCKVFDDVEIEINACQIAKKYGLVSNEVLTNFSTFRGKTLIF